MNNTKISIIVPIYNTEKYLNRCVDSILSQSFEDFELLLIDDGSKDKSGTICDEYAKRDKRVRVFHKENGGVSPARNLGLEQACGEWVAFVDADDEITEGYLNISKQFENADVIQKPYVIIKDSKEKNKYNQEIFVLRKKDEIFQYYVQKRNNALWDKLIKMKLIGDRRFNTELSIGEDFLFFLSLLPKVRIWAFDNVGSYRYFIRKGSAMQSVNLEKRIEIIWENIQHVQKLTETNELKFLQKSIVYKTYVSFLYNYRNELNDEQTGKLKEMFYKMRSRELKYVNLKTKMKLLFCKAKFMVMYD